MGLLSTMESFWMNESYLYLFDNHERQTVNSTGSEYED